MNRPVAARPHQYLSTPPGKGSSEALLDRINDQGALIAQTDALGDPVPRVRVITPPSAPMLGDVAIQRMDHVGIVVEDLAAATAFFAELGMELEGQAPVEGRWLDGVTGSTAFGSTSR